MKIHFNIFDKYLNKNCLHSSSVSFFSKDIKLLLLDSDISFWLYNLLYIFINNSSNNILLLFDVFLISVNSVEFCDKILFVKFVLLLISERFSVYVVQPSSELFIKK